MPGAGCEAAEEGRDRQRAHALHQGLELLASELGLEGIAAYASDPSRERTAPGSGPQAHRASHAESHEDDARAAPASGRGSGVGENEATQARKAFSRRARRQHGAEGLPEQVESRDPESRDDLAPIL